MRKLRGNGENMRKLRGNRERVRKWSARQNEREKEFLYYPLFVAKHKISLFLSQNIEICHLFVANIAKILTYELLQ